MAVDSFKFLPRILTELYQLDDVKSELPIPWTPLPRSLSECKFGLITTGGLYQKGVEPPFDLEREMDESIWGDPSYRTISTEVSQSEMGVSHLHLNTQDIEEDFNILLPIHRFQELVARGRIKAQADEAYSFMGFQGYPANTEAWEQKYAPEIVTKFISQEVDCILLTPA